MFSRPALLLDRAVTRPKISVLLIDWGARESFHSLDYLRDQTVPRSDYELIWVEFYDHRPPELERLVRSAPDGSPALDRWVVCGYPRELIYHKHRLYNVGSEPVHAIWFVLGPHGIDAAAPSMHRDPHDA